MNRCTDVFALLVFLCNIGFYGWTAYTGISGGAPRRVTAGQDWEGNICGLNALENFPYLGYTLNMTVGLDSLVNTFSQSSPSEFAHDASENFPTTKWLTNGLSTLEDLQKNFIPVCLSNCTENFYGTYLWEGPLDRSLRHFWVDVFLPSTLSDPSKLDSFYFNTLSAEQCPYNKRYCVSIFPSSLVNGFCEPITNTTAVHEKSEISWTANIGKSYFGIMLDDLVRNWLILFAFFGCSVGLGFLFIVLMIYFPAFTVCAGVFGNFAIMSAGGVTAFLYANKCLKGSLTQSFNAIVKNGWNGGFCVNGDSISDERMRFATKIFALVVISISFIFVIFSVFVRKRVEFGISIIQVSARFLKKEKNIFMYILVQIFVFLLWLAAWSIIFLFTITDLEVRPDWTFPDWKIASDYCSQVYLKNIDYSDPLLPTYTYGCKQNRYKIDWRSYFQICVFFWVGEFMVSLGRLGIAGSAGIWYFSNNRGTNSVRIGFMNALLYHLGTAAFGSIVLSLIMFLKWISIFRQVSFLDKNAFTQTAFEGTNFLKAGKDAAHLLQRNSLRFSFISDISGIINFIGRVFIISGTTGIAWLIIFFFYDGKITSPNSLILFSIVIGYFVSGLLINLISASSNAIIQAFLMDAEAHQDNAQFATLELKKLVQSASNYSVSNPNI